MGPIAYSFDPKTLIFSGAVKAQPCKIQVGVFYCPRFATFKKPPEQVAGRSIYFNIGTDAWEYGAPPAPAVVVEKQVVEKGVEVRENLDLLKQTVANEKMILGIELQKKLDAKSREVLDLVMSIDSKIQALEAALNGIRAVVQDNAQTCNSALSESNSAREELENLKPGLEQMMLQVSKMDVDRMDLLTRVDVVERRLNGELVVEGVKSEEIVSSLTPKKSWKFWS